MTIGWFFIDKNQHMELWAKCNKRKEWNKIEREDITKLKLSIEENCDKCKKEKGIIIEKVYFARKGMKHL